MQWTAVAAATKLSFGFFGVAAGGVARHSRIRLYLAVGPIDPREHEFDSSGGLTRQHVAVPPSRAPDA